MQRTLQQIVGTSEDINWEAINTSDFTSPYGRPEPYKLEGDAFVIIGKESPELTDMDWDLAINDPSRLKRRDAIPQEIINVESTRGKPWVSHYYQDINLLYVNKGDTYEPTVIYDALKDIWYIGRSWGDVIESDEKRFDI